MRAQKKKQPKTSSEIILSIIIFSEIMLIFMYPGGAMVHGCPFID